MFGPPLPPPVPTEQVSEYESRPLRTRDAFVKCAADYAGANAAAAGVTPDDVVSSALYSCRAELEDYRTVAAERARGYSRILGLIDRTEAHTDDAVEQATEEAKAAALDALIRKRAQ